MWPWQHLSLVRDARRAEHPDCRPATGSCCGSSTGQWGCSLIVRPPAASAIPMKKGAPNQVHALTPVLFLCCADDYAPAQAKARWFAAFYLCIPVGFAAGRRFQRGGRLAGGREEGARAAGRRLPSQHAVWLCWRRLHAERNAFTAAWSTVICGDRRTTTAVAAGAHDPAHRLVHLLPAAGYIYGGLVGASLGWRAAFLLEGLLMVPFVVFAFISKPLHLTGSREQGPGKAGVFWSGCIDAL